MLDHLPRSGPRSGPETVTPPAPVTGAEALVDALVDAGVELVFGYPGGAIMPVYDALFERQDRIRHVLVRHEQGAIHAAQGYARVGRRPGVCLATSGPGATNLVTGIADAQRDSTPVVCITGQVASTLLGTAAFQETDIVAVTAPLTKWSRQVTRAEDIPTAVAEAFAAASAGRPGPVLLDVTKDAQLARLPSSATNPGRRSGPPPARATPPRPSEAALDRAAALLDGAARPLIIVGQGVLLASAEASLLALAERIGAPVAATLLGLSAFPSEHPQWVGMVGMHGRYAANLKTNECDVLLAVGMRFDDRVTGDVQRYARQAKIIHVELDAAELDRHVRAEVGLHGDAREVLDALLPRLRPAQHEGWMAEFRRCDAAEIQAVVARDLDTDADELRMGAVVRALAEKTGGEAVVVTDVGQHQMIAARYSSFVRPRTSVTSGGLGTMGFALPAAIGARLARPDQTVVAVIGDGGFQMTLQELGTAVQADAPVKIVVLNNGFLGMVRQWQELFFASRYSQTELHNPDFVTLARAYAVPALRVRSPAELGPALDAMLAHPGVFLVEVVVEREANVFPMIPPGGSPSDVRLGP